MANPTTNYGWPMPTSTDLVTDLPADFAAFGQPVDTSLKALNPETTLGDIAYRSATSNTNTRLGIGTAGQVLAVSGGVPAWTTTADVTPLTTKGDLFTFSTVDARLAVGTNGQVLTADSSEATGLKYTTPSSSYTLLSTTSLTGASTTISGISGAYKDLQIVVFDVQGATSNTRNFLRLNGVSTQTYRVVFGLSYQTANLNFSPTSAILTNNTNTGSAVNTMIVTIPNYASTSITKVAGFYGFNYDNNTPSFESFNGVGSTEISDAITSLVFSRGSGNLTAGTVLVYGVN